MTDTEKVLSGSLRWHVELADCLEWLAQLPADSIDLIFGSPPYGAARTYGIGFSLKGQAWVDWMVSVYKAALRVCKGLVAFVVAGQTHKYQWSALPALLMADLHRAGICLRNPAAYHRKGIPGSGGPDFFRNDWEPVILATRGGKLPWSDKTALGHPPKYPPGGKISHRLKNGDRVDGGYKPPKKANPGNVITCKVGGGHNGSKLAHGNEAPFPEKLADRFIQSFCPPGGIVADCFCGSGTTGAVAMEQGRRFLGCDIRQCQVDLSRRRIENVTPDMFAAMAEREGA
jgi:hypothetical protein